MTGRAIDISLVLLHLGAGAILVSSLWRNLQRRQTDVAELASRANQEHAATERSAERLRIQQRLLEDLRRQDPYVIEFMARDRYGYTGPGEVEPPLPDADAPPPPTPSTP